MEKIARPDPMKRVPGDTYEMIIQKILVCGWHTELGHPDNSTLSTCSNCEKSIKVSSTEKFERHPEKEGIL